MMIMMITIMMMMMTLMMITIMLMKMTFMMMMIMMMMKQNDFTTKIKRKDNLRDSCHDKTNNVTVGIYPFLW